ncbi:SLC13 family permease [Thermococcus paralvinellae]|uniref:Cation transporter n=1 Tax=Thermococcus paralvinellae TaxID=582419 RepID=W0I9R7_9EURY|nr:SLC13 family permease [Thermococcus paralvinellae]AHF81220.1 cation transporter [Thermococcus paralvinellae]
MKLKNEKLRDGIIALIITLFYILSFHLSQAMLTLLLLVVAFVLFFTELIPIAFTALMVPVVLSITRILDASSAFLYFGYKWVIVFLFMFMVGEGLFRTGAAQKIGGIIVRVAGKSEIKLMLLIMIVAAVMSGFLSNTATTVALIPIVVASAYSAGISSKRLLLPLAWAASLGGTLTVIGTPPNGIVNSILEELNMKPFGFFEFGKIGLPLVVIGIALSVTVGRKFLPSVETKFEGKSFEDVEELRTEKMWLAVVIFILTIASMMLKLLPYQTAAALGALLMVAFGIITPKEALNSVSWTTVFLFAGMLPLSKAMETTKAAEMIGNSVVSHVNNPYLILLSVMFIAFILGNSMSHTATTAILSPLAVSIAQAGNISPYPLLMAIAMTSSIGFWTPISTPPNTIVFGSGGYTFMDYIKAGAVIEIILFAMLFILIPMFYPF